MDRSKKRKNGVVASGRVPCWFPCWTGNPPGPPFHSDKEHQPQTDGPFSCSPACLLLLFPCALLTASPAHPAPGGLPHCSATVLPLPLLLSGPWRPTVVPSVASLCFLSAWMLGCFLSREPRHIPNEPKGAVLFIIFKAVEIEMKQRNILK